MNVCSCSFTAAFSIFLSAPYGGWCLSLQPMNPFLSKGEGFCRIIENFNLTYTNPCFLSHCTKFRGRNDRKIHDVPFFLFKLMSFYYITEESTVTMFMEFFYLLWYSQIHYYSNLIIYAVLCMNSCDSAYFQLQKENLKCWFDYTEMLAKNFSDFGYKS